MIGLKNFCIITQKGTKNGLETGRTFATLLADVNLRRQLLEVATKEEFKQLLSNRTRELIEEQRESRAAVRIKLDNVVHSTTNSGEANNASFFSFSFFFLIKDSSNGKLIYKYSNSNTEYLETLSVWARHWRRSSSTSSSLHF